MLVQQKVLSFRPEVPGNFELGPISSRLGDSPVPILATCAHFLPKLATSLPILGLGGASDLATFARTLASGRVPLSKAPTSGSVAMGRGAASAEAGPHSVPAMPLCCRGGLGGRMRPARSETAMQDAGGRGGATGGSSWMLSSWN
jgi:hypothetical protein